MRKLLAIVLSLFTVGCESGPSYEILKSESVDQPSKFQTDTRILLTDSITPQNITSLLNDFYKIDSASGYKKIFIYVYKSKSDYESDGSSWIGMISQTPGDIKRLDLK